MNKDKIMKIFFENPAEEMHLREIARKISLSPNTVMHAANELVKEGLLAKERRKPVVNYRANLEGSKFAVKKRLFNLGQIYDSGLIDYLVELYNSPNAVILFGSYSKGEDTQMGDIDIAVVTDRQEKAHLESFEKKLKKSIHMLEIDKSKISREFLNSLANGIVLYGYLSVK